MKLDKPTLGLAAEFAVASELCRRNLYAQLTLGLRKRTDILIEYDEGMLRIQVKAKQGRDWPNCKGVYGDEILIFVDFENKKDDERPDFYILTSDDWRNLVETEVHNMNSKGRKIEIDEHNIPVWPNQKNYKGEPYKGMGVRPTQIQEYKEQWGKIKKKNVLI